jgi:hypothetical protein
LFASLLLASAMLVISLCYLVEGALHTMLLLVIVAFFPGFTLAQKFTLDAVKGSKV